MGTGIYVMPLWRFKTGDFVVPIATNLGNKAEVGALSAKPPISPSWHKELLAKLGIEQVSPGIAETAKESRQSVVALKHELTGLTARAIDWPDEGDVQYAEQFKSSFMLPVWAKCFDRREGLATFGLAPGDNGSDYVWEFIEPGNWRYPTIASYRFKSGYLLPLDFQGVYEVESIFAARERLFSRDVASTNVVARELEGLVERLAAKQSACKSDKRNPFGDALDAAKQLQTACALSLQHSVPVIFHT